MSVSPSTDEGEGLSSLTNTISSASSDEHGSTKTQIEISIKTTTELQLAKDEDHSTTPTPSSIKYEITIPALDDQPSSEFEERCRSYDEEFVHHEGQYTQDEGNGERDEDDDDDDTLSSEAMVDDIELILMPDDTTDDLPEVQSPKLVRVRELMTDSSGHLVEDDEDDECNFRKMDASERSDRRSYIVDDGSDEGEPMCDEPELEGAVGYTIPGFCRGEGGGDDDEPSFASTTTSGRDPRKYSRKSLASSGVQTDITALESSYCRQPIICDYRYGGSGSSGRKVITSSSGKKINWKSELTLLPSKTKVGHHIHGGGLMSSGVSVGFNGDEDERDQYSPGRRVAKFTSQDNVLSSSSQFLKPSTLYRTRNLSRNLNQLGSSESSFILPETETVGYSPRYRTEWANPPPFASGKGNTSFGVNQRRPTATTAKPFRSSLPDLSLGPEAKAPASRRRQSHQYARVLKTSLSGGGQGPTFGSTGLRKCRKKSSSDDETSSLIDESERCLRSSIDLLLTDDIPPPGYDYPYHNSSTGGLGRRYCSQPILTEDAYFYREPRNKGMGSPFLPRRMADMRCSKYAKVILPDGQVSVVNILEIDEIRDTLKVLPDSGSPIVIPFRKVVFAWRNSRR